MSKTKTVAALLCALSLAGVPALTSAAFAQEPMKGADPMTSGSGSSMDKGGMDNGGMTKKSMTKKSMSKKSMSKKSMMMKKHKKMM